jgi:hypothetical protein
MPETDLPELAMPVQVLVPQVLALQDEPAALAVAEKPASARSKKPTFPPAGGDRLPALPVLLKLEPS